METLTQTEENYLKAIFALCQSGEKVASTNALAQQLNTSAASVTDMLKRISGKGLINYERHRGVTLTLTGDQLAKALVRKHRLWEVFLVNILKFSWDEVHDMAEQLEHIQSPELVERLDQFLGRPPFDPHGDPIPDADGRFALRKQVLLSTLAEADEATVVGVQDHSTAFLQYLDKMNLGLGAELRLLEIFEFDGSMRILIGEGKELTISSKVSGNLFVQKK